MVGASHVGDRISGAGVAANVKDNASLALVVSRPDFVGDSISREERLAETPGDSAADFGRMPKSFR